jgi:hypothetical protein
LSVAAIGKSGTSRPFLTPLKNKEYSERVERGPAALGQIRGSYQLDLNFCRLELLSASTRPIWAPVHHLLDEFRINQSRGISPAQQGRPQ